MDAFQIGQFPLYYAVVNEDQATAKCLIRCGANVNKLNKVIKSDESDEKTMLFCLFVRQLMIVETSSLRSRSTCNPLW